MSYADDLLPDFQRLASAFKDISQAIHENGLINDAIDRHYAHIEKQAKLNTPSGKYVDVALVVKTEEEKAADLAKFDEVIERLEKRRHRRPHRRY